eukprot:c17620_g1_i1.p1 GENE.c17620_g1_i1~~c17620_g1_i1.p1  ORF type:complete len:171 (-),score=20.19 c17620_g1_i1:26-514(-)
MSTKESGAVIKRLQSELMSLMMSGDSNISAFPNEDNLFSWTSVIKGPAEGMYDSMQFQLSLTFPPNYPFAAPTVKFVTPCFHPNVDQHGNICLDILKDKWSAAYTVRTILLSIQSLLDEPNNDSPLNTQAAQLWVSNPEEYKRILQKRYAEAQATQSERCAN